MQRHHANTLVVVAVSQVIKSRKHRLITLLPYHCYHCGVRIVQSRAIACRCEVVVDVNPRRLSRGELAWGALQPLPLSFSLHHGCLFHDH